MVIVLAVAGILIWKFAPVDEAINSILPSYNNTSSGGGGGGGPTGSPVDNNVATAAPTDSPQYQFIQCNDGQPCCNGLDTNCNLRANQVLYATLHNAMATFDDGFIFGPNHQKQLESAVEAGYRGINLDLCNCGGQTIFWYVDATNEHEAVFGSNVSGLLTSYSISLILQPRNLLLGS